MNRENFYNPEHIEAFLEDRLSPADAASFSNAIAQDPLLKNEVTLQQEIVEAIKNNRKAELKARLNKVEVSSAPTYLGAKIAASVLLSAMVGWGIYSFTTGKTETQSASVEVSKPVITTSPAKEQTPVLQKDNETVAVAPAAPEALSKESISQPKRKQVKTKNSIQPSEDVADKTVAVTPDAPAMMETDQDQFINEDNGAIPQPKLGGAGTGNSSDIQVAIDKNSNKNFHYKFKENKVLLYGNFESSAYEILELNTSKGKQVYLYYNNSYYKLQPNQVTPAPLVKITDQKLIADLNKYNRK